MKKNIISLLTAVFVPLTAFGANEGVPSYYQTSAKANSNQLNYNQYRDQGYTKYVGSSGQKQIVGSRTYTYQTQRAATVDTSAGAMTVNGISAPEEKSTYVYGGYTRRFADFQFKTGVNSVLEWDDMQYNELTVGAQHKFSLRNFELFAYGEYSYGNMDHGGLSMDYDLEPYDWSDPTLGIFTISMGGQSGETQHMRFGIGAHHIWDIAGWKLSPTIGYEILKHDLKMSDHLYPNQGIYLPLMTNGGEYVYGDEEGNFYSMPIDIAAPDNWYQVCMGPEDIKLVPQGAAIGATGYVTSYGDLLPDTIDYDAALGIIPWGVSQGECVIIGGDGPIRVDGITHIYNTTWSGFYVGLEIEKQMTLADKLRFYVQFSLPKYSSEGIWPNRTDWQQNPSFLDEGSNGAFAYTAEMEYNYRISERLQLALKVDTNYFHVGKIPGELYIAEHTEFATDPETGQYLLDENDMPYLITYPAETQFVTDSLKEATWQSFGAHLGIKYAF